MGIKENAAIKLSQAYNEALQKTSKRFFDFVHNLLSGLMRLRVV